MRTGTIASADCNMELAVIDMDQFESRCQNQVKVSQTDESADWKQYVEM